MRVNICSYHRTAEKRTCASAAGLELGKIWPPGRNACSHRSPVSWLYVPGRESVSRARHQQNQTCCTCLQKHQVTSTRLIGLGNLQCWQPANTGTSSILAKGHTWHLRERGDSSPSLRWVNEGFRLFMIALHLDIIHIASTVSVWIPIPAWGTAPVWNKPPDHRFRILGSSGRKQTVAVDGASRKRFCRIISWSSFVSRRSYFEAKVSNDKS